MRAILFLVCIASVFSQPTPAQLANQVTPPVFDNAGSFLSWDYGGAIITDAFWEFADHFGRTDLVAPLNKILDEFINAPSKDAYKILHNEDLPFGGAIGDTVGLYPIAYLARVAYYNNHPDSNYNNETDLKICETVANHYILGWPYSLPDGTTSRKSGWSGEPAGDQFLWDDDMYMGLALISRLAVIQNNRTFSDRGGKMQGTFASHVFDQASSLYWHGYNNEDDHHSCCKWSRGNGWLMMSHVEVLKALKVTSKSPYYAPTLEILQKHAKGVLNAQADSGLWYQLLDDPTSFQETSSSAMFLWTLVEAISQGWLDKATYGPVVEKAWAGLVTTIHANGTVSGVCEGTGIGANAQFYKQRSTAYLASSPGLGSVFKAITAYDRYLKMK